MADVEEISGVSSGTLETLSSVNTGTLEEARNAITVERERAEAKENELEELIIFVDGQEKTIDLSSAQMVTCAVSDDNLLKRSGGRYKSYQIEVGPTWKSVKVQANATYDTYVTFVKTAVPVTPVANTDAVPYYASGETGRHTVTANTTTVLKVPSDASHVVVTYLMYYTDRDLTPALFAAIANLTGKVTDLYNDAIAEAAERRTDVSSLKITDTAISLHTGHILYWGDAAQVGISNDTFKREADVITINQAGDSSVNRSAVKISGELKTATASTGLNNFDKTVNLTAGHKYKLKSEIISGSVSQAEGYSTAKLCIRLRSESNTDIVRAKGYDYGIGCNNEIEFSVDSDTKCAIVITSYIGIIADNLKLRISLIDLTVMRANMSMEEESDIPEYYFDDGYLEGKVNTIMSRRDSMSANSDSFIFVTDYHHQYNEGRSAALIRYISKHTGITKLFNGGDNGGASAVSDKYKAARLTAGAIDLLEQQVKDGFCVLGNHEWNDGSSGQSKYSTAGAIAYYLEKYKTKADKFDQVYGNYWFDNVPNKIRYFFIQDTIGAYPQTDGDGSNKTLDWFAEELAAVPDGYTIVTVVHHGYIPNADESDEYGGVTVTYNRIAIKGISQMLAAVRDKTTFEYSGSQTLIKTYDFTNISGTHHIAGIFCGHLHHGHLYTESNADGIKNIAVFRGSTDCLHAASISLNGHPWYWENGTVGGTKIERLPGTTDEQCFYVVQIDLAAKHLYITAIGGDHDWDGTYEPSDE